MKINYCKYCGKLTNTKGLQCNTCVSKVRRFLTKTKAVAYLGGKCIDCGYNKHLAALEFHHLDASTKDFNFGNLKNFKWETIKKELDKCVCICSNCHKKLHAGLITLDGN